MHKLKAHFPGYEKGAGGTFAFTREHLVLAEERSSRLAARFTAHDGPEPFTAVGEIVGLLTSLKK